MNNYKVASGYPDVRGWEVKDADKRTVGKVDNLLVNKKAERVVYIDVEVDDELIEEGHEPLDKPSGKGVHEFINKDGENHLIIPVGLAGIDEDNKYVFCNKIDNGTFRSAKRHNKGDMVEPGYELTVYRHYVPDHDLEKDATINDDFYNRKEFIY